MGRVGNSASHSPWVVRQVVSHFNYEICELRRRPGKLSERLPMGRRSGSRRIEFIIRPNFLTSNSR
ncbi:hypothetical protein [Leptospira noguchii]|uniref:hypothetical protein n=1 Tax=Leptospira noguchii TaxID=28182 RepID=UPI0009E53120|nr:hypothetical protein [Leptospira noguchii]